MNTEEIMKLTDEEIKDILVSIDPDTKRLPPGFRDFARAIEAALSAKQGEQEVVDSEAKASAYMEAKLWEFIDMAAAFPNAKPDQRIWGHVMVYAPEAEQEPCGYDETTGNCTRNHCCHPTPSVNAQEESNQCGNGAGCCYRAALLDCKDERISELERKNAQLLEAFKCWLNWSADDGIDSLNAIEAEARAAIAAVEGKV